MKCGGKRDGMKDFKGVHVAEVAFSIGSDFMGLTARNKEGKIRT